jgi:hypothetical protein
MGVTKLIYGFSMLMNPFLGLVSDLLVLELPRQGRSVFILAGVAQEAVALVAAREASRSQDCVLYLVATCQWMFGEALVDIVTEAIVPETLPAHQYDLASSVRSMNFLVGGAAGYLSIGFTAGMGTDWLYPTYMVVMVLCALPPLIFALRPWSSLESLRGARGGLYSRGLGWSSIWDAYITPLRFSGCFPASCLAIFLFSLATGPCFFALLTVRDVVGIQSEEEQRQVFVRGSLGFVAFALVGALALGVDGNDATAPASSRDSADAGAGGAVENRSAEARRWALMLISVLCYGVGCILSPLVYLAGTVSARIWLFYGVTAFMGVCFGSCYTRFKSCSWILLPPGVDVGNAMGVTASSQLVGVGIGNFCVGVILEQFKIQGEDHNSITGYVLMCFFSAFCAFLAAYSLSRIMASLHLPSLWTWLLCSR